LLKFVMELGQIVIHGMSLLMWFAAFKYIKRYI